jgi:hypothetical protein
MLGTEVTNTDQPCVGTEPTFATPLLVDTSKTQGVGTANACPSSTTNQPTKSIFKARRNTISDNFALPGTKL